MKRLFLSGVAIAACFGLATDAKAQYGANYQYSSYGAGLQEAAGSGTRLQEAAGSGTRLQEAAEEAVQSTQRAVEQAERAVSPSDLPLVENYQNGQPRQVPAVPAPVYGNGCPPGGAYGQGYGQGFQGQGFQGQGYANPGAVYSTPAPTYSTPAPGVVTPAPAGTTYNPGVSSVYNPNSGPVYNSAPVYSSGPVYNGGGFVDTGIGTPYTEYVGGGAAGLVGGGGLQSNSRNRVFGIRGLLFSLDNEDDFGFGRNSAGRSLFSTDADHDFFGGFEASYASRGSNGVGWEASYFGLFPDHADANLNAQAGGSLFSNLPGTRDVQLGGASVFDILNAASEWRLQRDTEIHNVEINLLRNAGQTRSFFKGTTNVEWIAGIRWLKFSEGLSFQSVNFGQPAFPEFTFYNLDVENNLVGAQLGLRLERAMGKRGSFSLGSKFGVFNNDIHTTQLIFDQNINLATVPSGPIDYSFGARKDEVATLGEFDFGFNYQVSQSVRANIGYRVIGITGLGLAADQIPANFNDTQEIQRVKSNGSLLLHGFHFGFEKCF